ncbi:MAG: hypothetical protein ACP5N7_03185 [Candidatus Pacearchaeota archaeon]
MRYLFLGRISSCPDIKKLGSFAYHFADRDESGNFDLESQRDSDFVYGISNIDLLRRVTYEKAKATSIDVIVSTDGIPQVLKNKWIPDKDYQIERLSDEEVRSFNETIIVEQVN